MMRIGFDIQTLAHEREEGAASAKLCVATINALLQYAPEHEYVLFGLTDQPPRRGFASSGTRSAIRTTATFLLPKRTLKIGMCSALSLGHSCCSASRPLSCHESNDGRHLDSLFGAVPGCCHFARCDSGCDARTTATLAETAKAGNVIRPVHGSLHAGMVTPPFLKLLRRIVSAVLASIRSESLSPMSPV
ncbi:MAG: hypothetical protein KatS3mg130_1782 [Candidatus Sumerlaea sp.]|nr:MAG: hypothetical protein KatS3mg130_1782 [Candidatus Sumerlaea sp.]